MDPCQPMLQLVVLRKAPLYKDPSRLAKLRLSVSFVLVFAAHISIQSSLANEIDRVSHAEKQLARMMHDRPEMLNCVTKGDIVWQWTLKQFAASDLPHPVNWDKSTPKSGKRYQAESTIPSGDRANSIRLRNKDDRGKPLDCERLWAMVVFKSNNITNARLISDAHYNSVNNRVSRYEYVKRMVALEYQSARRTKKFYEDIWLPMAKRKGMLTHPEYWCVDCPDSVESFLNQRRDTNAYPWDFWGRYYDEKIAPYFAKHEPPQSLDLLSPAQVP